MSNTEAKTSTLTMRTLRTALVLVGVCVIFVGLLSVVAVTVTGRALNTRSAAQATDTPSAKKPLSI